MAKLPPKKMNTSKDLSLLFITIIIPILKFKADVIEVIYPRRGWD